MLLVAGWPGCQGGSWQGALRVENHPQVPGATSCLWAIRPWDSPRVQPCPSLWPWAQLPGQCSPTDFPEPASSSLFWKFTQSVFLSLLVVSDAELSLQLAWPTACFPNLGPFLRQRPPWDRRACPAASSYLGSWGLPVCVVCLRGNPAFLSPAGGVGWGWGAGRD